MGLNTEHVLPSVAPALASVLWYRLPLIKQPSNSGVHGKPQAARDQQMGREEGTPVSEDAQWV